MMNINPDLVFISFSCALVCLFLWKQTDWFPEYVEGTVMVVFICTLALILIAAAVAILITAVGMIVGYVVGPVWLWGHVMDWMRA